MPDQYAHRDPGNYYEYHESRESLMDGEPTVECYECGIRLLRSQSILGVGNRRYCPDCREVCTWCGEAFPPEDAVANPGSDDKFCCKTCAELGR